MCIRDRSYLTRDEQAELWDLIGQEDATPSLSQALRMKQLSREADVYKRQNVHSDLYSFAVAPRKGRVG